MITNSMIAYGDQLGAQMYTFVNLLYLAKENKQDICFYNEYKKFRRRFLILENFDLPAQMPGGGRIKFLRRLYLPIPELYCIQFSARRKVKSVANSNRIYYSKIPNILDHFFYRGCRLFYPDFKVVNGKNGVHCDASMLNLDSQKNYDIHSGFGTYQDWKKYENLIPEIFKFKEEIVRQANEIYSSLRVSKPSVAVHFRKGDYLLMSSLNLTLDYYKKALENFNKEDFELVVFSDDIESCKNTGIFDGYKVHYMDSHPAGVDMYVMSLCDNNIVANSTFSFWGAFLNRNPKKKVVCPRDFIGKKDSANQYINGNWYPSDWIAL